MRLCVQFVKYSSSTMLQHLSGLDYTLDEEKQTTKWTLLIIMDSWDLKYSFFMHACDLPMQLATLTFLA